MNSERTLYLYVHVDTLHQTYQASCGPNYTIKDAKEEILARYDTVVPVLYHMRFFHPDDQPQQHPISHTEKWNAAIHGGGSNDSPIVVRIRNLVTEFAGRVEDRNCPDEKHVYSLSQAFTNVDDHWKDQLPSSRFGMQEKHILYRPEIVNRLVAELDHVSTATSPVGIIVQGLQGVGKSHSLVNLVRRLRFGAERQRYHVTFVPDCEHFEDLSFLYEATCRSFGATSSDIAPRAKLASFREFTAAISTYLTASGKIWVFVFDQINKILAKQKVSNLSHLKPPESHIKGIMRGGKVVSIISASANNQAAILHEGFQAFQHELQMSRDEIRLAFPSLPSNEEVFEKYCDVTGRVPLQMLNLIANSFDEESYEQEAKRAIKLSLTVLHNENASTRKNFIASALSCIFRNANGDDVFYDRKYLVRDTTVAGVQYKAAFPAVLLEYYDFYFDQIMDNLDEILSNIARTWVMRDISGAERGWIFERGVIGTCKKNETIEFTGGETIPSPLDVSLQKIFESQSLPKKDFMAEDGMYIPKNSNFPAIDFIWKQQNIVVAVQAHVNASHKVAVSSFQGMMEKEGSWGEFERVILLYLSPYSETAEQMRKRVVADAPLNPKLEVVVASVSEFTTGTSRTPLSNIFPNEGG